MVLSQKQIKNVQEYCRLNDIKDIDDFIIRCFTEGYNIKKYGLLGVNNEPQIIEKEVEKIVEVVKEVEVPVEKIIEVVKEVPGPIREIEVIKYVDRDVVREITVEVPIKDVVPNIDNNWDKLKNEHLINIDKLNNDFKKEREEFIEKLNNCEKTTTFDSEGKQKQLQDTLNKLRRELSEKNNKINKLEKTIEESETNSKPVGAVYMKGSNLNN